MNPHNKYNSIKNSHNYPSQTNNPGDEPIDAEIIAETPTNVSTLDEEETTINLTYYPVLEQDEPSQPENDDPLPLWLKQGLISLSTPWGLGSLSLIVVTNVAVAGVQLWKMQQTPQDTPSATLNLDTASPSLSIPNSLNIARKSPNKVILDGLSTVSNPSTSTQSPQPAKKPSPIPSASTQQVVNVNQPLSLTNAILPPSLQPQTPPNYGLSATPLKVPQTPKTSSSIPVAEIPRPVPSMTIQPPPPPINNQPVSQDEQVRQAIKQQLKMEENNQTNIPLGFNHKTRLEMQNGLNELSPELLPQQVKHLEQLQQREILDSEASETINIP